MGFWKDLESEITSESRTTTLIKLCTKINLKNYNFSFNGVQTLSNSIWLLTKYYKRLYIIFGMFWPP